MIGGGALAAAGIAAISVGAALDVANARAGGQDHRATIALVVPGSVAVIGGALLILAPWTFLSTFRVERERVSRPGWSGVSLSPRAEGGVDLGVAGRF